MDLKAYEAARKAAALADVSGWGKLSFRGPDRHKALHGLLTNDVLGIKPGSGVETCVLTPKGKLVADLMLYELGEELLSIQLPQATARIQEALKKPLMLTDTVMEDVSHRWAAFLVLGPKASEIAGLPFPRLSLGGTLILAKAGERPPSIAGLPCIDADTLETLRIEAGIPALGVDTDDDTLPLELPLERTISFTKGCYMGQETTARMKNFGHANRRLVGLKLNDLPSRETPVISGGKPVGRITSAVRSPALGGKALALGLVRGEFSGPGTSLLVGEERAEVVALPVA